MELLSIIVPVYNAGGCLTPLLDSLVKQTYQNKEIILVDDGSTDDSPKVCDEYGSRYGFIRVIHKQNEGISATRNRGLREAAGEYITFSDDDDFLDYQAYEILIDALEGTGSDIAACDMKSEYGPKAKPVERYDTIPEPYVYEGVGTAVLGIGAKDHDLRSFVSNKVYRKCTIGNTLFEPVHCHEDTVFTFQVLSKVSRVVHVALPLYHYRFQLTSTSRGAKTAVYLNALKTQEKLLAWCEKNAPQGKNYVIRDYLMWNTKLCESMLYHVDWEVFAKVQDNIAKFKEYIPQCPWRTRLLVSAAAKSWYLYKPCGMLNLFMKQLCVAAANFG